MRRDSRIASGGFLVLLVVVDLGELRIDNILLGAAVLAAAARATGASAASARTFTATGLLGLRIHRFAELHGGLRQRIGLGLDHFRILALHGLLEVRHGGLDGAPLGLADLRAVLGER